MARRGYTNIAPSSERGQLFADIAATQGMDPATHKHRVEMIDQALRSYAERVRGRGTMDGKEFLETMDYQFPVATDLSYYGPDATQADVDDYEAFAADYLSTLAGHDVTTYRVEHYDYREDEEMRYLRGRVWDAFCKSQ